jgi:hypothetical protein
MPLRIPIPMLYHPQLRLPLTRHTPSSYQLSHLDARLRTRPRIPSRMVSIRPSLLLLRDYTLREPAFYLPGPAYTERPPPSLSPGIAWSPRSFLPSTPDTAEIIPQMTLCNHSHSSRRVAVPEVVVGLLQIHKIPGAIDNPYVRGFSPIVFNR